MCSDECACFLLTMCVYTFFANEPEYLSFLCGKSRQEVSSKLLQIFLHICRLLLIFTQEALSNAGRKVIKKSVCYYTATKLGVLRKN